MEGDWSNLDLAGQDLSGRNIGRVDLSRGNFTGSNFAQSNLSESILVNTDLSYANFRGANLQNTVLVNIMGGSLEGTDFTDANLEGAFGFFDLSQAILTNATCPDGTAAEETSCASGASLVPPPLAAPLFLSDTTVRITSTPYTADMYYMGNHEYIPGVNSATALGSLIIGESSWRTLVGDDEVNNYTSTTWIVDVNGIDNEELEALGSKISADARVSSVEDWASTHKDVERNGGLIFGTPGLLSLQFVVASIAAVASSFVFLSLVLSQGKRNSQFSKPLGHLRTKSFGWCCSRSSPLSWFQWRSELSSVSVLPCPLTGSLMSSDSSSKSLEAQPPPSSERWSIRGLSSCLVSLVGVRRRRCGPSGHHSQGLEVRL